MTDRHRRQFSALGSGRSPRLVELFGRPVMDVHNGWRDRLALGLWWTNIIYGALLLLGWVLLIGVGDRTPFTGFLLLLPPYLTLAPIVILTPVAATVDPRQLLHYIVWCVIVFGGYMTPRWSNTALPEQPILTVLSNNAGQRSLAPLRRLIIAESPDLIVLQESPHKHGLNDLGANYQEQRNGEFLLLSKYPILNHDVIHEDSPRQRPIAVRYELADPERGITIALYNVHLPTPRLAADELASDGSWWGTLAALRKPEHRHAFDERVDERLEATAKLLHVARADTANPILAGDFNMTSRSRSYVKFTDHFRDAFAATGHGYGFTFPASIQHPLLAWAGPWLRLDYLFCAPGWQPVFCRVERNKGCQHRAIVTGIVPVAD